MCTHHVGALSDVAASGLDERLSLLLRNLVLRRTRQRNVDRLDERPWAGTLVEGVLAVSERCGSHGLALELDGCDGHDILEGEALAVVGNEGTRRVGQREDLAAQREHLLGGVLRNIAGAGNEDLLPLEGLLKCELLAAVWSSVVRSDGASRVLASCSSLGAYSRCDHLLDIVDETVSGGLWSDERSTKVETLSSENAGELVAVSLVGA